MVNSRWMVSFCSSLNHYLIVVIFTLISISFFHHQRLSVIVVVSLKKYEFEFKKAQYVLVSCSGELSLLKQTEICGYKPVLFASN